MQLVLDLSFYDDDNYFFLSVTHVAVNEDESSNIKIKYRNSIRRHQVLYRDRQAEHQKLRQDYFQMILHISRKSNFSPPMHTINRTKYTEKTYTFTNDH